MGMRNACMLRMLLASGVLRMRQTAIRQGTGGSRKDRTHAPARATREPGAQRSNRTTRADRGVLWQNKEGDVIVVVRWCVRVWRCAAGRVAWLVPKQAMAAARPRVFLDIDIDGCTFHVLPAPLHTPGFTRTPIS